MKLEPFVNDRLWTAWRPLRILGMPVTTRMTVIRLSSGDLVVHSPIDADDELARQIDEVGPVRHVVAPNKTHHLFVKPFLERYPDARLYIAPGLAEKRPDLAFGKVLGDGPEAAWSGDVDQIFVRGHDFRSEVVFFVREAKTLIVTDLLESVHAEQPFPLRVGARLLNMYERPGPPPDARWAPSDPDLFQASIDRIVAWDFERVLMAHGHPIPDGGKRAFKRAYRRFLGQPEGTPVPAPTRPQTA